MLLLWSILNDTACVARSLVFCSFSWVGQCITGMIHQVWHPNNWHQGDLTSYLYLFADALNASWKVNLIFTTLYRDGTVIPCHEVNFRTSGGFAQFLSARKYLLWRAGTFRRAYGPKTAPARTAACWVKKFRRTEGDWIRCVVLFALSLSVP